MKKKLCLLLSVLMLVSVLASCGIGDTTADTTSDHTSNSTDTGDETRETLEVPDTRYDGAEFCFLTRGGTGGWATKEIFCEELTSDSDNISNAVFERNDRILQDYGVTITELRQDIMSHASTVRQEVSAPTGDFQAIISDTGSLASMASNGQLWNLNDNAFTCMDFEKPWWDTNMAKGMSLHDRLYFATGDLLTSDNDATFIITFNKKLVKDYSLPDLYAIVENGEWTMDKFIELESITVSDNNGDGKLTYNMDVSGFAYTSSAASCFLFGGGVTMCTKDDSDTPVYSLNIERAQGLVDKAKLIFAKEHTINLDADVSSSGLPIEQVGNIAFAENHALFYSECMLTVSHLRQYDVDFGIIPFPKYTKDQADYLSMMHTTASCVSIPRSIAEKDIPMLDAMLEAMAYHAVDTLTKQYYEINLKTKTVKDVESGPMIDKVLASRVCDLAYYYGWGSNAFGSLANAALPGSGTSVASMATKQKKAVENSIRQLLRKMNKDS